MVGLLGCGCCQKCCPEGNVWSYNYYPATQGWPLESYSSPRLSATPSGLEFASPLPYTAPQSGSALTQKIRSVRFPVNGQDPPIKMGFGKLDLRNLTHQITVPSREDFGGWQPHFSSSQTTQSMQLVLTLGLAVRVEPSPFKGFSFGLEFEWTKTRLWRNGVMFVEYKLVVSGWTGNENFESKVKSKIRTYGPSSSVFAMYYSGDFLSNQLDLKSDTTTARPTVYDCFAYKWGAATQEPSDNLLIDPWTYYAQGRREESPDKLYCSPYYLVQVVWQASAGNGLSSHSFNNSRVLLRKSDWKYGNKLNL